MTGNIYEQHLDRNQANYTPLSPLSLLARAADVYPHKSSLIHGAKHFTWGETYARSRQLASALAKRGIGRGDTVAIMGANTPEMYEAAFGVPMTGAVLNTLNVRLDGPTIAFCLAHGEAKVLLTDREFSTTVKAALAEHGMDDLLIIDIEDSEVSPVGERLGETDYESLLGEGDAGFEWSLPEDEWDAISLNYTSGTTGNPKGVVYHHRGAYLNALSNVIGWNMGHHPTYLWTLPMFHCNGWCFPWSLAAVAGQSVCLRAVNAGSMYKAIAEHKVTHFCGAPIVLNFIINATDEEHQKFDHTVNAMTAAAPPPASTLQKMQEIGFDVIHVYGLTETYGPAVMCAWQPEWNDLDIEEQTRLKGRQGVRYHVLEGLEVMDPATMTPVPRDGATMGEIMFRGNNVMKGYLKNPEASDEAFAGGWFHSGDLAVMQPDGYLKIQDRSKDVIISGGENISSIEVEDTLYKHPAVLACAVVAKPDEKWGETPCAFIELKADAGDISEADIIAFTRDNMAHFKCPKSVVFCDIPKTSTGKVQKFKLRKKFDGIE